MSPANVSTNQTAPGLKQEADGNAVSLTSNDEFDAELLAAFKVESEEQLETSEYQLLILESDPENSKAINALFRAFHTIKGNAGFLKVDPLLGNLAHDAETVLSLCRDGQLKLIGQAFDLILESSVLMRSLLQSLNNSIDGTPTSDLIRKAAHLRQGLSIIAQEFNAAATSSASPEASTTDATSAPSPSSGPLPNTDSSDFFVDEECPSTIELKTQTNAVEVEVETKQDKSQNANETLRVDRGRLDLLVELIGELVIAESMARQDATNPSKDPASLPAKLRNMAQLNRITRTLQELGLSLRMVPLRSTFQKMTRVARDLMRKLDKPVDFIVEGENTELDKTVVDEIGDPLMHMVRNAIDHGIEASSEERVANGKPPRGKVVLNLRGKIIPVIDLRRKFAMEAVENTDRTCIIVVDVHVKGQSADVGILVDNVSEVLSFRSEDIGPPPTLGCDLDTNFILGMTKTTDAVTILLEIENVLSENELTPTTVIDKEVNNLQLA